MEQSPNPEPSSTNESVGKVDHQRTPPGQKAGIPSMPNAAITRRDPSVFDAQAWINHFEEVTRTKLLLSGWTNQSIDSLLSGAKNIAARADNLFDRPVNRNLLQRDAALALPEEPMVCERFDEILNVLWADHRLWTVVRLHHKKPVHREFPAKDFILAKYHVLLPFPNSVWEELLGSPSKWQYLRFLMYHNAGDLFWYRSVEPHEDISSEQRAMLTEASLGKMFRLYCLNPIRDWRPWLTASGLPAPVLRRLRLAAGKLAQDAGWCANNPGRMQAPRAPRTTGAQRSLDQARLIESMVAELRRNPTLSDYGLAKRCLDRTSRAARGLAKEARLLAFYREDLPVKFHKSRGEKA